MVASDRANIDPALLPPSPRAAYYHGLRVYHQIKVCRELCDVDIDPLRWGWEIKNDKFAPIMTDVEAGPPDILKVIRCGCKESCSNSCSCRKAGLKCAASCKECHGITCKNVEVIEPELDNEDRHLLDAFN